jgi:hypothetical protein
MKLKTHTRLACIIAVGLLSACSGSSGSDGATGPAGKNGENGDAGAVGARGATGPTGASGATGAAGTSGEETDAALVGAAGPQGEAGVTGPAGPQGEAGATGATGPQGATGAAGEAGAAGPTGPQGAVGPTGSFTSNFMFAFTGGAVPQVVAPGAPFLFGSGIIDGQGFTYDSNTGTFTATSAGDYEFNIIFDADDGGIGNAPAEYLAEFIDVPRPSDSLMDCHVPAAGITVQCAATFIMAFNAGQTFTLTNVAGPAYYGTYETNPFANSLEMTVQQLD